MPNKAHHEINRLSWNEGTKAHNSHKGDQAAFFRAGGNTLFSEESGLFGDIAGKSLLHLQCNSGQDSLSLANHLGATVTGVDISDEAIQFARKLSRDSGIEASFVRADVYDFFDQHDQLFDVAFSSYGAICWLSDIQTWGQGIASCLKPGGRFVLVDFHPALMMFDAEWRLSDDYMGGVAYEYDSGVGDYVAMTGAAAGIDSLEAGICDFHNPYPGVEYKWGVAEVVTAMIDAGLQLTHLKEYAYSNLFKPFPNMREIGGLRFTVPAHLPQNVPLMFSLIAERKQ